VPSVHALEIQDLVKRYPTGTEALRGISLEIESGEFFGLLGATLSIEERGYRLTPFRMDSPVGPVSVPIRVHDVSHVAADGTLANTFEARTLVGGLMLAKVVFSVRPVVRASARGAP
jgi:ABC-type histidine transport system ATPase subunit